MNTTLTDHSWGLWSCMYQVGVPARVDEDGSLFHLGEEVLIADLLCLWC